MDPNLKETFTKKWRRYLGPAELPIAFFYSDDPGDAEEAPPREGKWHCLIGDLAPVRRGRPLAFTRESIGCGGGRYYAGFEGNLRPGIEHFLSCGIPGEMEGERYKKTPELATQAVTRSPAVPAEGTYLIAKRWDALAATDDPQVIVFFAPPDVLSGLFTLANFDEAQENAVAAVFASGCGAILLRPLAERAASRPRAFLGMFDVSARPYVSPNLLTFAVPMAKFARMVENMDESFLITGSWKKVLERIERRSADESSQG